jgi:hypothetical protein
MTPKVEVAHSGKAETVVGGQPSFFGGSPSTARMAFSGFFLIFTAQTSNSWIAYEKIYLFRSIAMCWRELGDADLL